MSFLVALAAVLPVYSELFNIFAITVLKTAAAFVIIGVYYATGLV
jgi:hypothetical protein